MEYIIARSKVKKQFDCINYSLNAGSGELMLKNWNLDKWQILLFWFTATIKEQIWGRVFTCIKNANKR